MHHVCQEEYVLFNYIDFDGTEQKICRNCVDELQCQEKSEILKKVGDITVYETDESDEYEEEVDRAVLGGGGDEVSIMPVVYPRVTVNVSSLGSFLYVGSSSKPSRPCLPISLIVHRIQDYFRKKRGRKREYINPQEEKDSHEDQRKQIRLTVRVKLVVTLGPRQSHS